MKCAILLTVALAATVFAQGPKASSDEKAISSEIGTLRSMTDSDRAKATMDLAMRIRDVSDPSQRLGLAVGLSNLSTEGDFGRNTLQAVTDTLAKAVSQDPGNSMAPFAYDELANLSIYEKMRVDSSAPAFKKALANAESIRAARAKADFTLNDITGKTWTLSNLRGKVVLVNFWATWCPPCRKEMPDLEALYKEFKDKGLVVLAISSEESPKVTAFISKQGYDFPVLLDPGSNVNKMYQIEGIPNSFVYGRDGKLVATAIDMRTRQQMLKMLSSAGLNR